MKTLVLDQGYQPQRVVNWKRAVSMFFAGKVEVVEEYDEDIRSVSITIKMPAVVRLLRRHRGRRGVKFSRMNVAMRDGFSCQYCGLKTSVRKLTYDHVLPKSRGGRTCWENIVMACYDCNGRKANRTPEEAKMKLRKAPIKPSWLPFVVFRVDQTASVPEAWANWLYWNGSLIEG